MLVGALRGTAKARHVAQGFFDEAVAHVEPVTRAIAAGAARLRADHVALSLPDAVVIATGEALEAGRILTGDARWRYVGPRIEVIAA